jgi:very-short-patch-repair endonuclease
VDGPLHPSTDRVAAPPAVPNTAKTDRVFRISDLIDSGASRGEIQSLCKDSEKLRPGVWIPKDMDPWGRYALLSRAVLDDLQPKAMLTGLTAACLLDMPRPQAPPTQVFVRGIPRGAYGRDVKVTGDEVAANVHDGLRMAEPAVMVADCARWSSARDCLSIADRATHQGLCGVEDLARVAENFHGRRGVDRIRWVAAHADPAAESPGETWTRIILKMLGYAPRSQVVIRHAGKTARVDFLLEDGRTVVEFDGLIKYAEVAEVASEKDRQAWLESRGYVVVRILWKHLLNPEQIALRLRRLGAVPSQRPLALPVGWHINDPVSSSRTG